jgi:hypothetical protein
MLRQERPQGMILHPILAPRNVLGVQIRIHNDKLNYTFPR